jgi:hypothetical protein
VAGTPTPLKNDGRSASWDDFPFPFLNGKMTKIQTTNQEKILYKLRDLYIYIFIS